MITIIALASKPVNGRLLCVSRDSEIKGFDSSFSIGQAINCTAPSDGRIYEVCAGASNFVQIRYIFIHWYYIMCELKPVLNIRASFQHFEKIAGFKLMTS